MLDSLVTLTSDDGGSFLCRVLSVFEFHSREHAVLLHMKDDGGSSAIIMQLVQERGQRVRFSDNSRMTSNTKVSSHLSRN